MKDQKELLEMLKAWKDISREIENLINQLNETQYRITPIYSGTSGAGGGLVNSKVESLSIRRLNIQQKINNKINALNQCKEAYLNADLTDIEKQIVKCICNAESLINLARIKNIQQTKIYRMRDQAVEKMFNYIKNNSK